MALASVRCPACKCLYHVEVRLLGKKGRCNQPTCGATFVLTEAAPEPADDTVPLVWHEGDVILGLYEVKQVHEGGATGLVYRVRHKGWGVDLAVKSPRPESLRTEADKASFEAEAETWVTLGLHPHTVTCYYVRRLGGLPRVFTEHVEGGSLKDWIDSGRLYDGGPDKATQRILDIAIQIAWGLQHAHEQGLVHGDVKPGNVMLTIGDTAKVSDFGLVSAAGPVPAYCSPEQANREEPTLKADIWGWAVSVLEMFTQQHPSFGPAAPELLEMTQAWESVPSHLPRMPPEVMRLLRRCLQGRPEARPQDLGEIATTVRTVYEQVVEDGYPRQTPRPTETQGGSLNNRALSLLDLGGMVEAERLWERVLEAQPGHPEASYNLGLVRWRSGRLHDDQFLAELRRREPGTTLSQALVHLERGDSAAAVRLLEHLTGPTDQGSEAYEYLGIAREQIPRSHRSLGSFVVSQEPKGHVEPANQGWIDSLAVAEKGAAVLVSGFGVPPQLWDLTTGTLRRQYLSPDRVVHGATWAGVGNGGRHVLALDTFRLRVWDAATGEPVPTPLAEGSRFRKLMLPHLEQPLVVLGEKSTLTVWNYVTGECLHTLTGHPTEVAAVCLSDDGRILVSGGGHYEHGGRVVKVWDLATGACLHTLEGHTQQVQAIAVDGTGRFALTRGGSTEVIYWDLRSGQRLGQLDCPAAVSLALNCDGTRALVAGEPYWKLFALPSGRCLYTQTATAGGSARIKWLNNHSCVVLWLNEISASDAAFALRSEVERRQLNHNSPFTAPYAISRVKSVEVTPNAAAAFEDRLTASALRAEAGDVSGAVTFLRRARALPGYQRHERAVAAWADLSRRTRRLGLLAGWEERRLEADVRLPVSVDIAEDDSFAVAAETDGAIHVWDLERGRLVRTILGDPGCQAAVLSRDGKYLLTCDHRIHIWEVSTGERLRSFEGHGELIRTVRWGRSRRFAFSGGEDGSVRLWAAKTGRCLRVFGSGHRDPVGALALSGDGCHLLSGSGVPEYQGEFKDAMLNLWDVVTGKCLRTLEGHTKPIHAVDFHPDGRHAFSAAADGTVRCWDLTTGEQQYQLGELTADGHSSEVRAVCVLGDGRFALTASGDKTVKLWDLTARACLRTLEGHTAAITSLAVGRDGCRVLSGAADGVKQWRLEWQLDETTSDDWDEVARAYLTNFLTLHVPPGGRLRRDRAPTEEEIRLALSRRGRPAWTEDDFQQLLRTLGCAGYGWLKPAAVRRELEHLAASLASSSALV